MKHFRIFTFLIPVFFFVILNGCSQQEDILAPEETSAPTAQLDVSDPPSVECCTECGNTCILGYGFSPTTGGYPVEQISADECDCVHTENGWTTTTTGTRTSQTATWGGGGSGSPCNNSIDLMVLGLFGNNCGANWHIPPTGPHSDPWGGYVEWTNEIWEKLRDLDGSIDPGNSSPFGLGVWPASWGISVEALNSGDLIRIELSTQFQADNFRRVGIFPNGTNTPVGTLQSNGSKIYVLDLSGQPDGFYNIKLDFAPGFNLNKVFQKSTPRR